MKLIPNIYVKNIESIPYQKLKEEKITCLVFDLDNTLALLKEKECPKRVVEFIKKLKKDFQVFIITNSPGKRAKVYQKSLEIPVINFAMKPLTFGLKRLMKKYNLKKEEMIMIGDQLMTDIKSGAKFGIKTILVDPLGQEDLKITKINRLIENRKMKKYLLERGKYYE